MLKAAIFDMDGLMFDTEPLWDKAFEYALEQLNLPFDHEFRDSTRGISGVVLKERFAKRYGEECDVDKFVSLVNEFAYQQFLAGAPKKPGLVELLDHLKQQHIRCIIASSSEIRTIQAHWNRHGLDTWFEGISSGQEVKRSKPDPDVFLLAAQKLGVEPWEAVVLEDSIAGVQAGIAGGFHVIMVPDTVYPSADLQARIAAVVPTLHDAIPVIDEIAVV